jgi:hypothetical protein
VPRHRECRRVQKGSHRRPLAVAGVCQLTVCFLFSATAHVGEEGGNASDGLSASLHIRQVELEKVLREKDLERLRAERSEREAKSWHSKFDDVRAALEKLRAERSVGLLPETQHKCDSISDCMIKRKAHYCL